MQAVSGRQHCGGCQQPGRGETCGHVAPMAPACQILRWALALGLGLTFEVTHSFRSQGRRGPGAAMQGAGSEGGQGVLGGKAGWGGQLGVAWRSGIWIWDLARAVSPALGARSQGQPEPLTVTHR